MPSKRARIIRLIAQIPMVRPLWHAFRAALSPELRSVHRIQREHGELLLQPYPTTRPDRHPALFAFAQSRLAGKRDLRILSFGCSTGEEPIALAAWLPGAAIDAVDINPRNIAIARRKAKHLGLRTITFTTAARPVEQAAVYDAVFCLSVFRHGRLASEGPASCTAILPFAKFDAALAAIDQTIRPGGLLFIWGSNFHFGQSKVAAHYRPLAVAGMEPQADAYYSPDDQLILGSAAVDFVFQKLG